MGSRLSGSVVSFINIIPILGQIIYGVFLLVMLVVVILCIVNASQGKIFKVPVIGNFAAQQAGL